MGRREKHDGRTAYRGAIAAREKGIEKQTDVYERDDKSEKIAYVRWKGQADMTQKYGALYEVRIYLVTT